LNNRCKILKIEVGEDSYPTNTYIIYDNDKNCVIIDPGFDSNRIINKVKENDLSIKYVIITHSHADHFGALNDIIKYSNCKVIIHKLDYDGLTDKEKSYEELMGMNLDIDLNNVITVEDNDDIKVGDINLEVIHTPGHTIGCMCLLEKSTNSLFTGDTIFHNCYGRCDLKSSDFNNMKESINKLFTRFEDIIIYPGHEKEINIDDAKRKINLLLRIRS
jgi:hydroxyacylglutathione hydrolase